jgi:thiamine biosynthesis lipoprotein ApbE
MIWLKLKGYLIAAGAMLAALVGLYLAGRAKGKAAEQARTREAQEAAATAQAANKQLESRHETDSEVQRLPDAPAQTVATADPATAAGKLRDDGWLRD